MITERKVLRQFLKDLELLWTERRGSSGGEVPWTRWELLIICC